MQFSSYVGRRWGNGKEVLNMPTTSKDDFTQPNDSMPPLTFRIYHIRPPIIVMEYVFSWNVKSQNK